MAKIIDGSMAEKWRRKWRLWRRLWQRQRLAHRASRAAHVFSNSRKQAHAGGIAQRISQNWLKAGGNGESVNAAMWQCKACQRRREMAAIIMAKAESESSVAKIENGISNQRRQWRIMAKSASMAKANENNGENNG
jgi:hypothetical protein